MNIVEVLGKKKQTVKQSSFNRIAVVNYLNFYVPKFYTLKSVCFCKC